jgi:hypothetical protein
MFTDNIKNNIYLFGSLVHKDVTNIEIFFKHEEKTITYILYVKKSLLNAISQYNTLKGSTKVVDLLKLRYLLHKQGNLELKKILEAFIKDYCGPNWKVTLDLLDTESYTDGLGTTVGDKK